MLFKEIYNLLRNAIAKTKYSKYSKFLNLEDFRCFVLNGGIEIPKNKTWGDYSSNLALKLQDKVGEKISEIASDIIKNISKNNIFKKITAAENGFINFWFSEKFLSVCVNEIFQKKDKFLFPDLGKGKKACIEYVSANPTGPIHIGNIRGGPIGEIIAKLLESSGWQVSREYYHNDIGGQVKKLGESLLTIYYQKKGKKREFPEGGYKGKYLNKIVDEFVKKNPEIKGIDLKENLKKFALEYLLKENLKTCSKIGIKFDKIIYESDMVNYEKSKIVINKLKEKNVVEKREGAFWLAGEEEKEYVLIKSNGELTYFSNDIAYHNDKFERDFDLIIDILGSNHHGHVIRIKKALKDLGWNLSKFKVILYQFVRLKKGSNIAKMSKREGRYIQAQEVLDEVGSDAFLYYLLAHSPQNHIDFDTELAKEQSEKNPVYYIQYAYARISSILKKLKEENIKIVSTNKMDVSSPEEINVIKELIQFPDIIFLTSQDLQVRRVPFYTYNLSAAFHNFYDNCRVISEDKKRTQDRVFLVIVTRYVIKKLLNLMGISSPEKM